MKYFFLKKVVTDCIGMLNLEVLDSYNLLEMKNACN